MSATQNLLGSVTLDRRSKSFGAASGGLPPYRFGRRRYPVCDRSPSWCINRCKAVSAALFAQLSQIVTDFWIPLVTAAYEPRAFDQAKYALTSLALAEFDSASQGSTH